MKNLTTLFKNHLAQETTNLALCVEVARKDSTRAYNDPLDNETYMRYRMVRTELSGHPIDDTDNTYMYFSGNDSNMFVTRDEAKKDLYSLAKIGTSNNDYPVIKPRIVDNFMGYDDFTIEFWYYRAYDRTTDTQEPIIHSPFNLQLYVNPNNDKLYFRYYNSGPITVSPSTLTVPKLQWVHIAICRDSTNLRVYVNGAEEVITTDPIEFTYSTGQEYFTLFRGDNTYYTNYGYIDYLKMIKGTARYTTAFTPDNYLDYKYEESGIYRYTDHDEPLTYAEKIYYPDNAFIPSNFQYNIGLNTDNIDITGIVDDAGIKEVDIIQERFYDAEISVFQMVYEKDTDITSVTFGKNIDNEGTYGNNKILKGWLGEVQVNSNSYIAEFMSISTKLRTKLTDLYSKTCRAEFGDSKCGVSIFTSDWQPNTRYCVRSVVNSTSQQSRFRTTVEGVSGGTEPSWDYTIGNTTIDGGVTWLCVEPLTGSGNVAAGLTNIRFSYNSRPFRSSTIAEIEAVDLSGTVQPPDSWVEDSGNFSNEANLFDGDYGTSATVPNGNAGQFTMNYPNRLLNFSTLKIHFAADSSVDDFWIDISIDGGSTYNRVYTKNWAFDSDYEADLVTDPVSGLDALHLTGFWPTSTIANTPETISVVVDFDQDFNPEYIVDGYITFTSGLNSGLSIDIVGYDSETSTIKLFRPMPYDIAYGDTFNCVAGCNHLLLGPDGTTATGHCVARYDNAVNFRGEPYVPTQDVLVGGVGENAKEPYST